MRDANPPSPRSVMGSFGAMLSAGMPRVVGTTVILGARIQTRVCRDFARLPAMMERLVFFPFRPPLSGLDGHHYEGDYHNSAERSATDAQIVRLTCYISLSNMPVRSIISIQKRTNTNTICLLLSVSSREKYSLQQIIFKVFKLVWVPLRELMLSFFPERQQLLGTSRCISLSPLSHTGSISYRLRPLGDA